MRIDKITITEFGALKNRCFSLKDGINVFEGRNESGKSTVVGFIRFMLYGLPKKTASDALTDRDRGLSWDNQTAAGSMEVTLPDGSYRIERKYQLSGATARGAIDECKIIDLKTGSEVFKDELPGKLFLGIPADVYDSTSCVRQLECTSIDGNSVRSSIENLLLSADEKIDTKKAQNKLDAFRKTLLYKSAKGGRLYELELEKAELEVKLEKAKQDADVIIAKENAAHALSEVEAQSAKGEREKEREIKVYETCTVLKRFNELHAEEESIYGLQGSLRELTETRGFFGKLPDRAILDELDSAERTLADSAGRLTFAKGEMANAEASPCGDRILAALHEKVEQNGKKPTILAQVTNLIKKRKSAIAASVIFYILGGILLLVGALGLLGPLVPNYAFLLIVSGFFSVLFSGIPSGMVLYALIAITVIGAIFLILGITRSAAASKRTKERLAFFADYGLITSTATPAELEEHIDKCEKHFELCRRHDDAFGAASEKLSAVKAEYDRDLNAAMDLLSSIATKCEDRDDKAVSALLRSRRSELTEVCALKEALELELKAKQNTALSIKTSLEDYNESELRADIPATADVNHITENTDIADIRRKHEFYKNQYAAAMQKRIGIEKELIGLTSTAENPAKLNTKLDEVCRELEQSRLNYNALVMAINAIDTASDNIRKNVTPTIRKRAGELMGMLTSGKYNELGLSPDLEISANIDGFTRSIEALSRGTRDAAYISLRMALVELICGENPPPFTFDEGFSLLDDVRTKNMLTMLYAYTRNGGQCLLFTCHKRETEILRAVGDFTHIIL